VTGEDGIRPVVGALRLVLVPFVGLALAATLSLTLRPGATADYFAWTIAPPYTAALLGAGYGGALVLFVLSLRERYWANARIAVSAPFTLSTALLAATLLHLDKFHLDEGGVTAVVAWVWLLVYLAVPPALLVVVLLQHRVPGGDPPRASPLPPALRATIAVVCVASIVRGAVLSKGFILLVAIANMIAWPLAWYTMEYWLQGFPYRISINPMVFAIAGLGVVMIAFLSVGVQTLRAAAANPARALRME
jgi:hypothetical protein